MDKLKHISNQALLEELTGRVQQKIISLDETTLPILKVMKNSTLLKELGKRVKDKEIRFNYSNIYPPQKISGLIS
jgi:hypothetical protein